MATKRDLKKLIRDTCGGLAFGMISPADFATRHEYAHDRRAYFAKAYKALMADFWQKVEEIISHMNAALPDDVRAILKKAADA